nr:RecName: Full=Beta-galactosidase; Short=Lactase [Phoenix dactylifera]
EIQNAGLYAILR